MEAILRGEPCLNEAEFSSVVKHMNMKKTAPASILVMLIATVSIANGQTSPTPTPVSSPTVSPSLSPHLTASASPATSPFGTPGPWDPMADMQRMQTEMNQFFSRAMSEFGSNPNLLSMRSEPGFASTLDVRDKGDHYEIHAFLPSAAINNVKVTAESNNMLRVTASQSNQQKNDSNNSETLMSEFGEYQQLVSLPGPARTKDMKVERKEHEVVITIPKKTK